MFNPMSQHRCRRLFLLSLCSRWSVLLMGWFLLGVAGCGKEDPGLASRPAVFPVAGVVLYKDQPVEGAHVTFRPSGDAPGAFGRTDKEGRFQLQTFKENDGAVKGEHKVTVQKTDATAAVSEPKSSEELFGEMENQAKSGKLPTPVVSKSLLPTRYADPKQTELKATVLSDASNSYEFKLKD